MIAAVVLAAGLSTRMGRPKMILPWGAVTVIGRVVITLQQAGVDEIVVVTGGARAEVETAVTAVAGPGVQLAYNPRYAEDVMGLSLQVGMSRLSEMESALLVVLGDQPQLETSVVRALLDAYSSSHKPLIVPSYQMRRGHPWLVARSLWGGLRDAPLDSTLRDFLNAHREQITYLPVETASILRDLDTPNDYEQARVDQKREAATRRRK